MEYSIEEFYNLVVNKFGNKFTIKLIQISDENLKKFNEEHDCNLLSKDFEEYRQVWLLDNKCPNCNCNLLGMMGTFQWGIVHGYGNCTNCGIGFKYYHYIGDSKIPLKAFSISSF